jgi:hypothetical protein
MTTVNIVRRWPVPDRGSVVVLRLHALADPWRALAQRLAQVQDEGELRKKRP